MSKNESRNRKEAMAELLENIQMSHFDEMEKQRDEIAEQLGLDSSDIDIDMSIIGSELAKQGVIVELKIGRARFEIEANARDFGLNTENPEYKEFLNEYIKMGKKLLLPNSIQRKLNKLETRARRTLEKHGYKITRYGCFVPFEVTGSDGETYELYNELKEELEEIKTEYFRVRDQDILDRYESIRWSTYMKYREAAHEVYRTNQKDPYCEVPQEFIDNFTGEIMKLFPSKEDIYDYHRFDINLRAVGASNNTSQLNAPPEVLQELRQSAIREVNDFVSDIMVQLRSMMYEAVTKARECVQKHGRLQGPNVGSLKKMIEKINKLNFANDRQVKEYISEINELISREKDDRDMGEIKEVLSRIEEENRQVLLSLGHEPRKKRGRVEMEDEAPEPVGRRKKRDKVISEDENGGMEEDNKQQAGKRKKRVERPLFNEEEQVG